MHSRNALVNQIAAPILLLLVTGCGRTQSPHPSNLDDPWGIVTVDPGKTIRIGVALSNTASKSANAELARGVELAFQHYQTVAGFRLEPVPVDTKCSAEGGQTAASRFVGDTSIVAVVGPDCSSACQSSMPLLEQAHYTAISPGCAASDLTDPVRHVGSFVRTIYPDTPENQMAARFAYRELGARRIAIIDDGSVETQDAVEAFSTQMTDLGGKIVARVSIVSGESNMEQALSEIADNRPDLVYAPLMVLDAVNLLKGRQAFPDLANIPLLGGRHYWNTEIIERSGQLADGVYATGPYATSAPVSAVNSDYQRLYMQAPPSSSYTYAYDAVGILVEALGKVATTGDQGRLLIGRQALRNAIYSTANYPGLTGNLTCTAWGDCGVEILAVSQVQNGKWTVVYMP